MTVSTTEKLHLNVDDGTSSPMPADFENGLDGVYPHLGKLPENTIITEDALARMLGVCARTIRRMVERCELPPPFRNGGRSCWLAGMVVEWLAETAKKEIEKSRQTAKRMQGLR